MKKFLAVFFSVLFVLSCFAMAVCADEAEENTTVVNVVVPLTTTCKYCGQTIAYTDVEKHETNCPYKIAEASNTCYFCKKSFNNEQAYNQHMATYNACENHVKQCPYNGENYVDGGCQCTFKTVAEYENHVANCSYKTAYTQSGYLNALKDQLIDFIKAFFKGINWSALLDGVKGIFAGADTGALKGILNSIIGAIGLDFSI